MNRPDVKTDKALKDLEVCMGKKRLSQSHIMVAIQPNRKVALTIKA